MDFEGTLSGTEGLRFAKEPSHTRFPEFRGAKYPQGIFGCSLLASPEE